LGHGPIRLLPDGFLARLRQPQDHVAVALARATHGPEAVDEFRFQPDLPIALGVGLAFEACRAERERTGDRLEGGGGDGEGDKIGPGVDDREI